MAARGTVMTISDLTSRIKELLEGSFGEVYVEGELSNWRPASSGHCYFTLKDSSAQIQAVMFKGSARSLSFNPQDGMLLRVRGRLSVYPQRGNYQIIVETMEQSGAGDILAMLEERKRALAAEGLFDRDRKRPLPPYPAVVGVVTSPTGAALRDILNVLRRRAPAMGVLVLPALVQGEGAGEQIARRIEQANRWSLCDVLIVGRGGGALEDLLPFSEELVVRSAARSAIPVISAVGHEIDWAILDYAADLRAPTPSAAAELVSQGFFEAADQIEYIKHIMEESLRSRLERARLLLRPFSEKDLEFRLMNILQPTLQRFDDAKEGLLDSLRERITLSRRRLELGRTRLEALSPLAVMDRGFSVVLNRRTGKTLRDSGEVQRGDSLLIRPRGGALEAEVTQIMGEQ